MLSVDLRDRLRTRAEIRARRFRDVELECQACGYHWDDIYCCNPPLIFECVACGEEAGIRRDGPQHEEVEVFFAYGEQSSC